MNETPLQPPPLRAKPTFAFNSIIFKMMGIVLLILLLLIPLGMIQSILSERLQRRNAAIFDITSSWGREQMVAGPVLVVPYRIAIKSWMDEKVDGNIIKREVTTYAEKNACFLPALLDARGEVDSKKLHRGIYEAVVYDARLQLKMKFEKPDFSTLKIAPHEILWDDAYLSLGVSDLRGAKGALKLQWGEKEFVFVPGTRMSAIPTGIHAPLKGAENLDFSRSPEISMIINGSTGISFVPVGRENRVQLKSSWPDPSFRGAFLPADRQVSKDGFVAGWNVSYYGRNFPQQWSDPEPSNAFHLEAMAASSFGVNFLSPVDQYRTVERSIKYGILFLVLVFTAFFLFEITATLKIHPMQYLLVGCALCLFYLGLLSISELTLFSMAYLVSATAATLLISLYSWSVLKSGVRTLFVAAGLALVYGYLYIILQLQDYSLLFGTVGLFLVLAIVMYVTRNIDWYSRDLKSSEAAPPRDVRP